MLTDPPGRSLLLFALPMIFGNLFQQFYNMADAVIVGKFVGSRMYLLPLPSAEELEVL